MKNEDPDYDRIASNLRNPVGDYGLEIAEMMNKTNAGMINHCIHQLSIKEHDTLLELGPGNGKHCLELLTNHPTLTYKGLDISNTMVNEANSINRENIENGTVEFSIYNGYKLPFSNSFFNHVFTVNTIYFWEQPLALMDEIFRVSKKGATVAICYADADFMKKLPFTQKGFTYYQCHEVEELLTRVGFCNVAHHKHIEDVIAKDGTKTERIYYVTVANR